MSACLVYRERVDFNRVFCYVSQFVVPCTELHRSIEEQKVDIVVGVVSRVGVHLTEDSVTDPR